MSIVDGSVPTAASRPRTERSVRPATLIIGAIAVTGMTLVALHVINQGYVRVDVEQLRNGEAWRSGGWLSQIVLRFVSRINDGQLQQLVLSLVAAAASGVLLAALYHRLRANGWIMLGALVVLCALALHAGGLYVLTANSRAIPLLLAVAVLIPAIRAIEETGDVQAAISMGLLLPLLLLASPLTTPLVLPFAIGATLADRDARRDPRAFIAVLLVTILPTVIVAVGIVGFVAQARLDVAEALLPYIRAFSDMHLGDPTDSLLGLVVYAPVMLVPVLYCHVVSALAIVVLPLYLVMARETLTNTMSAIIPPLVATVAFASWLAVVRLPRELRLISLAMLVLSAVATWTLPGVWGDPEWRAALLSLPIGTP